MLRKTKRRTPKKEFREARARAEEKVMKDAEAKKIAEALAKKEKETAEREAKKLEVANFKNA